MAWDPDRLNDIYDRTDGRCHLCGKKLAFCNFGRRGARGCWEVEHSVPRSRGGTDRLSNLYAACIECNRSKGAQSTRSSRAAACGRTRAPLNRQQRRRAKALSALGGGMIGAGLGSLLGPVGGILGGALGARAGYRRNPDR